MLRGSIVALITPMKANGDVDWSAMDGLIDWHLESGTNGFLSLGEVEGPLMQRIEELARLAREEEDQQAHVRCSLDFSTCTGQESNLGLS